MKTKTFVAAVIVAAIAWNRPVSAAENDFAEIKAEITKRHDEAVKRLQDWIELPSIAAENRDYPDGAEYMAKLARDAGFQQATVIQDRREAGRVRDARRRRGENGRALFHVRREAVRSRRSGLRRRSTRALVDKPGFGKAIVGRGAVNQKGPEAAFLAALHAIRGAGKKMPVNLVMVAEGEEEIGSPHIAQIVHRPEVQAALGENASASSCPRRCRIWTASSR